MGFFLWLSDLHLDPFYGTDKAVSYHNDNNECRLPGNNGTTFHFPYGRVGCDTPLSLLEATLRNAKANNNDNSIDFILITGDFVRHLTNQIEDPIDFTESVLSTCIRSIRSIFSENISIIPVLGNNDVTPDYYLDVHATAGEYNITNISSGITTTNANNIAKNSLLRMARNGLSESFLSEEESRTFVHGGYFARIIETTASSSSSLSSSTSSILVLSLNTVIYSINHHDDNDYDDPLDQFAWIESQLQTAAVAKNNKITAIYVVGHIPPTIGSYRHSQMWHERYLDRYALILKKYYCANTNNNSNTIPSPPIKGNLFGHMHTAEFRLLSYSCDDDDADADAKLNNRSVLNNNKLLTSPPKPLVLPFLVTSSITPIYGSNPSYRIVEFDDDSGSLLDYTTYYLDLTTTSSILTTMTIQKNESIVGRTEPIWIQLLSFTEAYHVPDLSSDSFETILSRLEEEMDAVEIGNQEMTTTTSLWDTFLRRQRVYSSPQDDGNDGNGKKSRSDVMIDWLCTLRAASKDDYTACLEVRSSSIGTTEDTASDGLFLFLIASTMVAIGGLLIAFFIMRKRHVKRRYYHEPSSLHSVVKDIPIDMNTTTTTTTTTTADEDNNSSFFSSKGIAMKVLNNGRLFSSAGEFT